METQQAVEIWSTLVPGGAIAFHAAVEGALDTMFGHDAGCSTSLLWYIRTATFVLCWAFGLFMMKWSGFSHGSNISHYFVNAVVVTSWLLAISRYPLECYLGHVGTDEYNVNDVESRSVGLVRLILMALIEAASAFEIMSYAKVEAVNRSSSATANAPRTDPRSFREANFKTNNLAYWIQSIGFTSIADVLEAYDTTWRQWIPATALTFQATVASSVESAFASVGFSCSLEQIVWRLVSLVFSFAFGIAAVVASEDAMIDSHKHFFCQRVLLVLAWLLSVSEGLAYCIVGRFTGVLRLSCTMAVVGMTVHNMKQKGRAHMVSSGTTVVPQYGTIV